MFYILLSSGRVLRVDIMEKVLAMTRGRVRIGPGTLYSLLDSFLKEGLIRETGAEGRRRSYLITDEGAGRLSAERERLQLLICDYERFGGEGETI
jgi:DNA-binding PadR family transcriptional regulator